MEMVNWLFHEGFWRNLPEGFTVERQEYGERGKEPGHWPGFFYVIELRYVMPGSSQLAAPGMVYRSIYTGAVRG